ncbi:diiron oxygenase [Nocardia sp. NPDC048505]|uniref:AurF N-oxygenase family protein n=1 Tax=Nocardia sp. NPDC048505 TaxID=3155756 RepID=UPI0033E723A4
MSAPAHRRTSDDDIVAVAEKYTETLRLLSAASVDKPVDPFVTIDWEHPDFDPDARPERWILPRSGDPLGRHPWYLALPKERQIEIGKYRQANVTKVGIQFEALLISGMAQHILTLPNNSPEFEYCSHEMIEEHRHTMMFQEMVNRIGIEVPGMGPLTSLLKHVAIPVTIASPIIMFMAILGGEEPIDHVQKDILRSGEDVHPIMRGVMAVHIAEEARHISFAHAALKERVPQRSAAERFALSLVFPVLLFVLGRAVVTPPRAFFTDMGIPDSVRRELFFESDEARRVFADYFVDVRALAEEIGLMNPVARRFWKLLEIDGPASRYRSEPLRVGRPEPRERA